MNTSFISPFPHNRKTGFQTRLTTPVVPFRRLSCTRIVAAKKSTIQSKQSSDEQRVVRTHPKRVPSLFHRPEAVLGIVLVAGTLFSDFIQTLFQISSNASTKHNENTVTKKALTELYLPRHIERAFNSLKDSLQRGTNALLSTEITLDNLDKSLINDYQETRNVIKRAREQTVFVEKELEQIQDSFVYQQLSDDALFEIGQRDLEIKKLEETIQQMRLDNKNQIDMLQEKEMKLQSQMDQYSKELESTQTNYKHVKLDYESIQANASESEKQVGKLQTELGHALQNLEKEEKRNEQLNELLVASQNRNSNEEFLQSELSSLKTNMNSLEERLSSISIERDSIKSLLAARNAQLDNITKQLESAVTQDGQSGGNVTKSKLSLDMILNNLTAEKMALSSEIARAEIAVEDLTINDVDELSRIQKQIDAEGGLLKAGLLKAEATVKMEEQENERKKTAVSDVIDSLEKSITEDLDEMEQEQIGSLSDTELVIAKQAQKRKTDETQVKPKRKRGRPRKSESEKMNTTSTSTTKGTGKKRGRPRKKVEERKD